MESGEIRKRFIDYFVKVLKKRNLGHVEVPSSPLVPENHPSLLFVNSGMVQFTPYFLGERDPIDDFDSNRLCSVQKSVRTGDLDLVGSSKYHLTFFEMMGSWSIGDYGKKKAVELALDLLTNKNYGFGLDPKRLIPTVFSGNDEVGVDTETLDAWKSVGISQNRISLLPASENWWAPAGLDGPGPAGPSTEVLYDRGEKYGKEDSTPGKTDNPRYIEIWNAGVFMQYNRDEFGKLHRLERLSVDTGAGLERFSVLLQGVDSVYETDLFAPLVDSIKKLKNDSSNKRSVDFDNPEVRRALLRSADHLRACSFIISENVTPSNKDQGFVLRRLIRTVFNDFVWRLNIDTSKMTRIIPTIIQNYSEIYPEIDREKYIVDVISEEIEKTKDVADQARRFMKKNLNAFDIYQSTGASAELISNLAGELDKKIDFEDFNKRSKKHKDLSRKGAGKKFSGGLANVNEETTKFHTLTHILHAALRKVLGDYVEQKGSNITSERLRFDFSHKEKLTDSELKRVEDLVKEQIKKNLPVSFETKTIEEAAKEGALAFFGQKYGAKVKVYSIGDFSKEVCGGPHVKATGEIGRAKITKQEKIGAGLIRIYAQTL